MILQAPRAICRSYWTLSKALTHQQRSAFSRFSETTKSHTTCSGRCSNQILRFTPPVRVQKSRCASDAIMERRKSGRTVLHTLAWRLGISTTTGRCSEKLQSRSQSISFEERNRSISCRHFLSNTAATRQPSRNLLSNAAVRLCP